jgi:tetratricopeptide (TPR) repeat protein
LFGFEVILMSLTVGLGLSSLRCLLGLIGIGYSLFEVDYGQGATLSNEILKSAIGGSAGNFVYDFIKGGSASALDKMSRLLQQGDNEHLNYDLQRAARKAQLTATLLAARACLAETKRLNENQKPFWSKVYDLVRRDSEERWLNEVAKLWQQKIDSVLKEIPPPIIERDKIMYLLDPDVFVPKPSPTATDIYRKLVEKLKEDALEEIRTEYYSISPLPDIGYQLLEEAIKEGWNEFTATTAYLTSLNLPRNSYRPEHKSALINTDKQFDWFSLVCGFFSEEYKTNERVYKAMQKYLLLDIRDRQGNIIKNNAGHLIAPDVFFGHFQHLSDSLAHLEYLLTRVDKRQDEILIFVKNSFKRLEQVVRATSAETQQTVRNESEKIRQVTRDEIGQARQGMSAAFSEVSKGISELADLIRRERALSREEREARQENNRRQYQSEIPPEYTPSEIVGSIIKRDKCFVNRELERDDLMNRLLAGEKMVVVQALSGYGKTSLMTEVLHTIAPDEHLRHGKVRGILLFYCRDKEQASLREVCRKADARLTKANVKSNFAESYEFFRSNARDNPDILPTSLIDKLINDLSTLGDIWLVFDNFETALNGVTVSDPALREFFVRALTMRNGLRFLLTSQKSPQFAGIDRVGMLSIGDLPGKFAKEFLRNKGEELKADGIDCGLAEAEETFLEDLLRETTASPMRLVSFVGYLREAYLKHSKVLVDALADKSVMAAFHEYDEKKGSMSLIEKQYLLLSETERLILKALSIFPKAVPFAVLKSVLPLTLDEDEILDCLENSSLVRRRGSFYELLTSPKEVIVKQAEKPDKPYSRAALHTRAADFYASIRKPESQWKTIHDFAPQFDEMYHCRQVRFYDRAARVLDQEAHDFLQHAGYSRRVVEVRKELVGRPMSNFAAAFNLLMLAHGYASLGQTHKGIETYEKSLKLWRKSKDRWNEAITLMNIGLMHFQLGHNIAAIEFSRQALAIQRQVGDRLGEGITLMNLGLALYELDQNEAAIELYEQALAIHKEVGNKVWEAMVLLNLGSAYSVMGDNSKAIELYEQALDIHKQVGNRVAEGMTLGNLGHVKFNSGDKQEGILLVEQALEIARQVEDKRQEAIHLKKLKEMKS